MKRVFLITCLFLLMSSLGRGQDHDIPENRPTVTLFRHWHYVDGGDEEVIVIDKKKYFARISGPSLPKGGLEMEKSIAAIIPGASNREGQIILGPDETLSQPFQVIYWFDLGSNEVKFLPLSKVYSSVEQAKKESKEKIDKHRAKTYRALRWGI